MIKLGEITITAKNEEVTTGLFTGDIKTEIIDGGCKRISDLVKNPPQGCYVTSVDWSDLHMIVRVVPNSPAALRALADALER